MLARDCVFCTRVECREYDSYTDNPSVVWLEPLNPVTPGHLLFIPVHHVTAGSPQKPYETAHCVEYAVRYAVSHGIADYNVITSCGAAATQTISHIHVHLVPRADGDGLALPWTGQVKMKPAKEN